MFFRLFRKNWNDHIFKKRWFIRQFIVFMATIDDQPLCSMSGGLQDIYREDFRFGLRLRTLGFSDDRPVR